MEPPTTIAGKLETTKTELSPPWPDQVFVNVSDSPFQRPLGARIQQKDNFKQHGLNDLSGCIMTREEMRFVAILACKSGVLTSSNADPAFRKMDFLTGKMQEKERVSKVRIV